MTGDKNKDIVEEVFSRSMNVDGRVSAFLACLEHPPQVSPEKGQESPSDLKGSSAAKDIDSSDNKPFQSAEARAGAEGKLRGDAQARALAESTARVEAEAAKAMAETKAQRGAVARARAKKRARAKRPGKSSITTRCYHALL